MYWIDTFKLAEIHREAYAAILKSWVPHGKRDEFANKCGITREYLSCLCVLDSQFDTKVPIHKRYPSSQVARRIAGALPAPDEIKRSLLENMELAHVNSVKAYYSTVEPVEPRLIIDRLSSLEQCHQQATFGIEISAVQLAYRTVRNASASLLRQIDPEERPDSFVQACLYYHDSQCILNRADEALRYAKIAQLVFESIEEIEPGYTREQRYNLEMNAIRGEAVAYHNLNLDRKVPNILEERARFTRAYRNAPAFWEPIINRDLINSLVQIPRFSIRDVNKTAHQGELICEHNGDKLTLLLIHEAWLRSLIVHKKWKQAKQILEAEIQSLPHLTQIGSLHKVLLFKVGAQLAWKLHDLETWKEYVTQAVSLAHQAGLSHQMENIYRNYGTALNPIFIELGY